MTESSLTPLVAVLRARARSFFFTFFMVFSISYVTLTALSAVPKFVPNHSQKPAEVDEAVVTDATTTEAVTEESVPVVMSDEAALPMMMVIDRLNRELPILNPQSRSIADLDAALLNGVVRHPDSATFADDGTIFVLGHSSYLPQVRNPFFKALNGIQKLEWGDTIRLYSVDTEYRYEVERVYEAKASQLEVPIAFTGKRLTIATCDSFGSTDDRFIVEAKLVEIKPRS
jgi:LPXTG-site transpeptidase (sortase) family protein